MDKKDFAKLGKSARRAMILEEFIGVAIIAAVLAVIWIVVHAFKIPESVKRIDEIITVIAGILMLISLICTPTIGYSNYRYKINKNSIEKISGVFFIDHEVVPIRRIQQVSVDRGPILNLFKLANVTAVTAGSKIEIEFLPSEKAEIIVQKIRQEVNEFAELQIKNTEEYTGIIDIEENGGEDHENS